MDELTGRAKMREMLKEDFPDKVYSDENEDDISDFIARHKGVSDERDKLKGDSERIVESIMSHPENADLFEGLLDGEDLRKMVVKRYGKDILDVDPESPEWAEKIKKADDEFQAIAKMKADNEAADAAYQQNIAASGPVLDEFAKEKGWDEETAMDFIKKVFDLATPTVTGIWTKEALAGFYNAVHHEELMKEAEDAGGVAERNKKIKTGKKEQIGDGLPSLSGGGTMGNSSEEEKGQSMLRRMGGPVKR
jgi:hypothetical protein